MREWYLEPKHISSKSFYGKAKVVEEFNSISLISYNSCICQIRAIGLDDAEPIIYDVKDYYGKSLTFSATSLKHLREFLLQNGFEADSKKQIMKDYEIADGGQIDRASAGVKKGELKSGISETTRKSS